MAEDDQNFVVFGEPFDEDDDENSRFLHPKARPQAYEQRVLNERGRPMRFHGAFTGGFSAGYFNTVGSKEGFKPQSFTSSRRNRTQNAVQIQGKPEDFMDDEDFGAFGIAPRHYRTRREYDDHHIFDTLCESLGGKSVIPAANDILKRMLIPSGTSLADRLLRRMGWKSEDIAEVVAEEEAERTSISQSNKERDYAVISFAPKTNTFGLGYSGLDPEIAFGRRAPTSIHDPQAESVTSLQQREQSSHVGLNPSTGPIRQGIRGQAFGVGALHSEDADIYAMDSLATYDFSIAPTEEEADDEMADLEAAQHGRFSDLRRKSKPSNSTLDGWTPPTLPKVSLSGVEEHDKTDEIEGFVRPVNSSACLVLANAEFFVIPQVVHLPPGYNPVFHPQCLRGGDVEETSQEAPSISEVSAAPLLKPFVGDSAKQARFEAYQLLIRQGLTHEEAYERCSSQTLDLTSETRVFEAKVFATLVKNLRPSLKPSKASTLLQPSPSPTIPQHEASTEQKQERDNRPLTAGILDSEKQRLVANLLKSRFRSAGEMDITRELTAAQEEERRKDLESLDMTDPRDNAAANETYGVLTRRTLTWHPAALLCKRFNVPNPYPDSKFVGCPEDRRMRRPPRKGKRRADDVTSSEFTLFQLLDINVGDRDGDDDGSDYSEEEEGKSGGEETTASLTPETSTNPCGCPPQSIFEGLFAQSEKAQQERRNEKSAEKTESAPVNPIPRILGPVAPPQDTSKSFTPNEEGVPSMNLFKSIFASDEELEDDDDDGQENDDLAALMQPPPTLSSSSTEFRPSVVSTSPIQQDEPVLDEEKKKEVTRPPNPPDLSAHQLFKHLFNPEMDSEAPLFAVSKVANQRREERRMEVELNSTVSSTLKGQVSEDDFYGPSLPPGFGNAEASNISTSISVKSTSSSSKDVEYVERKTRKKDDSNREHKSRHHHHHHKHKRRHRKD
nr:G patch domain containing 1 [Hymenolepis microstoma]